ncbi:hypothetical protein D3C81_1192320 [compost metagenome]
MGQQAGDAAHVDHALDLIEVVAVDRQAGVGGGAQLGDDLLEILLQIDADHLVARDHDVVDRDLLQVEDAQQHALPVGRQARPGLAHHAAQFLGGQAVLAGLCRVDAEQAQQAVADRTGEPYQRVEQAHQQQQDMAGRVGDLLRAQGGQGLGGDLAEDQDDDGQ